MVQTPYYEEQLTDGLVYAKYRPHIHCFTFTNMTKETVDIAYSHIIALDKEYATKGIHVQYLYVLDDVTYTPYVLTKLKQLINAMPENLRDSSAIVADTFLNRALEAIVMPLIRSIEIQSINFCATEKEAFAWFEERRKSIGE